jgi:hypothetical protein
MSKEEEWSMRVWCMLDNEYLRVQQHRLENVEAKMGFVTSRTKKWLWPLYGRGRR